MVWYCFQKTAGDEIVGSNNVSPEESLEGRDEDIGSSSESSEDEDGLESKLAYEPVLDPDLRDGSLPASVQEDKEAVIPQCSTSGSVSKQV
jgi:hypothetical protein